MRFFKSSLVAFALLLSQFAFAKEISEIKIPAGILKKLNDVRNQPNTDYDFKIWVREVLDTDWKAALHLWSSIEVKVPAAAKQEAIAVYLISLWNEQLPQTFANQLLKSLGSPNFTKSAAWDQTEKALQPQMADFLFDQSIVLSPQQKSTISNLPWKGLYSDLKSWAQVRERVLLKTAVEKANDKTPWRLWLDVSYALQLVRDGKSSEAANFLTKRLKEPNVSKHDKDYYFTTLARIAYQDADLAQAENWYSQVDVNSEIAPDTHEEMLWVLLRNGDTSKLRGTLQALRNSSYKDRFMPELYVIRAISDLKLCLLDEAKNDFAYFTSQNKEWAKKIDTALKSNSPEKPGNADWYAQIIERSIELRSKELTKLESEFKNSIAASLPAIGKQKHWTEAHSQLKAWVAQLERQKTAEYKRQWRNNAMMLSEAIRKMKFVRIELLSQVADGVKAEPNSKLSASNSDEVNAQIAKEADGRWSFPFDGLDWADEKYALRSTATNVCL